MGKISLNHHDLLDKTGPRRHHFCPRVIAELPVREQTFSNSIILTFEDSSLAIFNCAFCTLDHSKRYLDLYTEHCGYHRFLRASVVKITVVPMTSVL